MDASILEILEFVNENDIKFVKLQFCDIFGRLKNIAIMSSQLEKAFTHGIGFDASSIQGFLNIEDSDLMLFPDPSTLSILPWRPQQGRVARFFCDIKTPDGKPFYGDSRWILKKAVEDLWKMGYTAKIGAECEFYLFKTDDEGEPTLTPHDRAGYFDIAPLDKGENIRREICLTLEDMGFKLESSHHESGPGQNEVDFMYDNPLNSADNLITFKAAVKTIANLNGVFASFMPKPLINESGSGLHINLSLSKNGKNIFNSENEEDKHASDAFIAGILNRVKEITGILNPTVNSYKRFGSHEAPNYITWSPKNRSQLIRIPAAKGEFKRMELRSADSVCNPYLAFSLLIYAGIDGLKNMYKLPEPINANIYNLSEKEKENIEALPSNLNQAIYEMEKSDFVKNILGEFVYDKFISTKKHEWEAYEERCKSHHEVTEWEINNYFYRL